MLTTQIIIQIIISSITLFCVDKVKNGELRIDFTDSNKQKINIKDLQLNV